MTSFVADNSVDENKPLRRFKQVGYFVQIAFDGEQENIRRNVGSLPETIERYDSRTVVSGQRIADTDYREPRPAPLLPVRGTV